MLAQTGRWQVRGGLLDLSQRPWVMGVLNVTPDSFSDGGDYLDPARAIARGREMVAEGADLLDVGGESSRPGAEPVSPDEELRRILPVVAALAKAVDVPLSVDTTKSAVAREALRAGAHIVNDISALQGDPQMGAVVAEAGAGLILMHMQGMPRTMQLAPQYRDVRAEVAAFLVAAMERARQAGVSEACLVLDPGLGFGKTAEHNWEILAGLGALTGLGRPLLVGASRKSFLRRRVGESRAALDAASLAVHTAAWLAGARVARAHDVRAHRAAADCLAALLSAGHTAG